MWLINICLCTVVNQNSRSRLHHCRTSKESMTKVWEGKYKRSLLKTNKLNNSWLLHFHNLLQKLLFTYRYLISVTLSYVTITLCVFSGYRTNIFFLLTIVCMLLPLQLAYMIGWLCQYFNHSNYQSFES